MSHFLGEASVPPLNRRPRHISVESCIDAATRDRYVMGFQAYIYVAVPLNYDISHYRRARYKAAKSLTFPE